MCRRLDSVVRKVFFGSFGLVLVLFKMFGFEDILVFVNFFLIKKNLFFEYDFFS